MGKLREKPKVVVKILLILAVLLNMFLTQSNAMEVQIDTSYEEKKVNEEIVYKIELQEKVITADLEIEYNAEELQITGVMDKAEYNEIGEGRVIVVYADTEGKGTNTIEIKFKAKKATGEDTSKIEVKDINLYSLEKEAGYGIEEIEAEKLVKEVKIVEEKGNNNDKPSGENNDKDNSTDDNKDKETTTGKQDKEETSQNGKKDPNEATKILPYTGSNAIKAILVVTGAGIIVAGGILINKKKAKNIIPMIMIGLVLMSSVKSNANEESEIYIKIYERIKNYDKIIAIMPNKENREITKEELEERIKEETEIEKIINREETELKDTDLVTTESKVKLKEGKEYKVVVYGDVNCDGKINSIDIAMIIRSKIKGEELKGLERKAANLENEADELDEKIETEDINRFKKYILRTLDENIVKELPKEIPENVEIKVEKLEVTAEKTEINKGETVSLVATVLPQNATNKEVTWESSNEEVATVDQKGQVIGLKEGKSTISATTTDGTELSTGLEITVKIQTEGVSLNKTETIIEKGNTEKLEAKVVPEDATNKKVNWTSSDKEVATVDKNGVVTALKAGETTITVTTEEGNHKANCKVTVPEAKTEIAPSGITLNVKTLELLINSSKDREKLIATIEPDTVSDKYKTIIWSSSDENVATVDGEGNVIAKGNGETIITAKTINGYTVTCTVKVFTCPSQIMLDHQEVILDMNGTKEITLNATIEPETVSDKYKTIAWSSSDENVATVDKYGNVVAIGNGETTITAKTVNDILTTCKVKVIISPKNITLDKKEVLLDLSGTKATKLSATIEPDTVNEEYKTITWSSTNENVVTVDEEGNITAIGKGTATITAKTINNLTATCVVTVKNSSDKEPTISITSTDDNVIKAGDTVTYTIKVDAEYEVNLDTTKIKLYDNEACVDENNSSATGAYNDSTLNNATVNTTQIDDNTVTVEVQTVDEINSVGHLTLKVEKGFAIEVNGSRTNNETERYDYVASLNLSPTAKSIGTAVGVANSFYIKDYDFNIKGLNSLGEFKYFAHKTDITTNEYIYQTFGGGTEGLQANVDYTIQAKVEFYIAKENDTTFEGWIESKTKLTENKGLEVHFLNTTRYVSEVNGKEVNGKATSDCFFIKTATGKTIMIDTAADDNGEGIHKSWVNKIDTYLRKDKNGADGKSLVVANNGIVNIDYLILTHQHWDHLGGFAGLTGVRYNKDGKGYTIDVNNEINGEKLRYNFGKIIVNCNVPNFKGTTIVKDSDGNEIANGAEGPNTNQRAKSKAIYCYAKDNGKLIKVTAGNVLKVDNIMFNIFNPYPYSDVPKTWLDVEEGDRSSIHTYYKSSAGKIVEGPLITPTTGNNISIVTKLICGSRRMLFMGDAEFFAEEILLGIPSTQVKNNTKGRTKGLKIHSYKNDPDNKDYVSLVADLTSDGTTIAQLESNYKISRLTQKDLSAQVLKKGHHGVNNSTSYGFLCNVKPNKIVSTGVNHKKANTKSIIKCVNYVPDVCIRKYYDSQEKTCNASNWGTHVYCTVKGDTHDNPQGKGDFYIKTATGEAWDYTDPKSK